MLGAGLLTSPSTGPLGLPVVSARRVREGHRRGVRCSPRAHVRKRPIPPLAERRATACGRRVPGRERAGPFARIAHGAGAAATERASPAARRPRDGVLDRLQSTIARWDGRVSEGGSPIRGRELVACTYFPAFSRTLGPESAEELNSPTARGLPCHVGRAKQGCAWDTPEGPAGEHGKRDRDRGAGALPRRNGTHVQWLPAQRRASPDRESARRSVECAVSSERQADVAQTPP
jgi:hypothetical protein